MIKYILLAAVWLGMPLMAYADMILYKKEKTRHIVDKVVPMNTDAEIFKEYAGLCLREVILFTAGFMFAVFIP